MDMTGERRIPAPRQTVWEALNDPEVLKVSIPGCESLERMDGDQMKATAAVKIGPMSARFSGKVQLSDIDPPNGYRISGEGQGGPAGFAKGGANVALADDGPDTLLSYQVNAQVGGRIAQLGARLIDATAKQMADQFFDRFSTQVQAHYQSQVQGQGQGQTQNPTQTQSQTQSQPSEVAPQVQAATPQPPPIAPPIAPLQPSAISVWSLIPREPFGLPLAAWIGIAVYAFMVLLMLGSML
jgi:uncharacterized protein